MGKIKQPKGRKGSLKWIQQIVNEYPDVLNKQINDSLGFSKKQSIEWLSPKAEDVDYKTRSGCYRIRLQKNDIKKNSELKKELLQMTWG